MALGWVRRAWDWRRAPRVGINRQGRLPVYMAKDGYRGPEMGVKLFKWVWRP